MAAAALASVVALRRRGVLARNALATPSRDVAGLPALAWFAAAVAIYAALTLGQIVGSALMIKSDLDSLSAMAGMFAVGYLTALGVGLGVVFALRWPLRAAGVAAAPADPLRGLIAFLLVIPIVWTVGSAASLLVRLSGAEAPAPIAHETLRRLAEAPIDAWWWITVAAVVIGAPIVEEVVYRGLLQSAALRAIGSGWAAVLITSAAFTFVHIGAVDATGLASLFVLSIGFGLAFERTGRLAVPIVMHAAFNLFNVAVVVVGG